MHHSRRKSGHGLGNTSMTDVRKAADSSSSRHKSSSSKQSSSGTSRRSGTSHSGSKSSKPSSHDREDDYYWDEERRESFPQYCMTCEKQFVAKDDRFLYCSEACRDYDQEYGSTISTRHYRDNYQKSSYAGYAAERPEPRDIIPRASPSRPSSTYFSPPSTPARTSTTLPANASTSSAIAALRSLSIRDASPPSPTSTSGIWPFASRSPAVTPTASYTRPSAAAFSANYDSGYYRTTAPNYYGAGNSSSAAGHGSERPLPPRRPGSYARPKSIELVTPLIGQ